MLMNRRCIYWLAALTVVATASPALAQVRTRPNQPDMQVDAATKSAVLDSILLKLDGQYVIPAVGKKTRDAIAMRRKKHEYDRITSAGEFGDSLTSHLRAASHDRHLAVLYSYDLVPLSADTLTVADQAKEGEFFRVRNYGFEQVERLRGNVGYIRLRGFVSSPEAGEAAAATMQLMANTDALIIDLRQNGGGNGQMVQLLTTYLLKGDPVHLVNVYSRPDNVTFQSWTLPWVPGPRYTGKEVYLLTSKRTFSAAEEFCFDLQNQKRVTIVGETTGGGAHPVKFERLSEHFQMSVPYARSTNPENGVDWEGVGVKPDVSVPADDALKTAHMLALKKLNGRPGDPADVAGAIDDLEKTGDSRVPTAMR